MFGAEDNAVRRAAPTEPKAGWLGDPAGLRPWSSRRDLCAASVHDFSIAGDVSQMKLRKLLSRLSMDDHWCDHERRDVRAVAIPINCEAAAWAG